MQLFRWIAVATLASLARAQTFSPWQAIGPFDHRGGATSLEFAHPPESELKAHRVGGNGPTLSAKSRGKNGLELSWKPLRFQPEGTSPWDLGEIDLRRQMPAPEGLPAWMENAAVYLYRRIEVASASDWTTSWNTDAPLQVWCDGSVVLQGFPAAGISRFEEVARVHLEAGVHHLLVKLIHSDQPEWRLRVREWVAPSSEALDQAIERAVDGLMQRQRPDGTWSHELQRDGLVSGAIAWALTDLGIERDLPVLQLALESARVNGFTSTEAAAWVALGLLRSKRDDDRRVVAECLTYLLEAQTSGGLWAKSSTNHKPDGPAQISPSFHALLALDALREVGSKIEPAVFTRAIDGLDAFQGDRKLADPEGVGMRAAPDAEASVTPTILGLTAMHWLARGAGAELDPKRKRELEERTLAAQRWLQRVVSWKDAARRAREWNPVALCAFALERARAMGGLQSLDGFDVLARVSQEFVERQRDDGLFQLGGARFVDEPLGLAVLIAARGPAITERRSRRSELGYDDFSTVGSGRLDVRLGIGAWAPKIEREFGDRTLAVKMIEFFGVPTARTNDAVALGRVRGGDLSLADIRQTALDIEFPTRGRWQVRARVVLEPETPGSEREGRVLLSSWLTLRVDRAVTEEQLADVRHAPTLPARGVSVEVSSKFDGWPAEKAVDGSYATGWACKDDDRKPWIKVTLPKAIKADGLRLVHAAPSGDGEQWPRATKVELTVNGKEHWTLDLDPEPTRITRHEFGETLSVRTIEIVVLEKFRPYASEFAGFSEIELIPERK